MAKIHVYETTFPLLDSPVRVGEIRCVYHVNISTVKNADAQTNAAFSVFTNSKKIRGAGKVRLGNSGVSGDLSTHPDFPGGGPSVSFSIAAAFNKPLNNSNIAAQLRTAFANNGVTLTGDAAISNVVVDEGWAITDGVKTHTLTASVTYGDIDSINVSAETDRLESALLASHDLAEVEVKITRTEGESQARLARRVDGLYGGVETKAQGEYTKRYKFYGVERNPA